MKIYRDDSLGVWTFEAVTDEETGICTLITRTIKVGSKIMKGYRMHDPVDKSFYTLDLFLGTTRRPRRKYETRGGRVTGEFVHIGGIQLNLCGSTISDKKEVDYIRSICWFSRRGLIYKGPHESITGSVVVTGGSCKYCSALMTDLTSCATEICDRRVTRCKHHWEPMLLGGGTGKLRRSAWCKKCHREKPKDPNDVTCEGEDAVGLLEREYGVYVAKDISDIVSVIENHRTRTLDREVS